MSDGPGTQHQGVFLEGGSAGFMTDLVFTGGLYGMNVGNQQYTMRNISISNAVTAFSLFFDWGWTMHGLTINNCSTGVDLTSGPYDQNDHAFMVIDSSISNTPLAFSTSFNVTGNNPISGGTLILENVAIKNVTTAITGYSRNVLLAGGTKTIAAYAQGNRYNPTGPTFIHQTIPANPRPNSLTTANGAYYTMSKPQYGTTPLSQFVSARSSGAKGNGIKDDTNALQKALNATAAAGQILFVDAGTYLVTKTLYVPPGARVVGESYSVIMSTGPYFNNMANPHAVVQIGVPGDTGRVEWSDMMVSTQGGNIGQAGAVLIEWNLNSPANNPSGMWDVHTRIGGTIGSNFQGATCPTTPNSPKSQKNQLAGKCYAAFLAMHITSSAAGLYLENNWVSRPPLLCSARLHQDLKS
jgi:glucan 1,3-beta-glucosidase